MGGSPRDARRLTHQPDIHPEVRELLERLVPGIERALGDDLVAAYLWGSATLGGYVPGSSDVDVLVCLTRDPGEGDLRTLHALHADIVDAQPQWHHRVEVAYAGVASLANFRTRAHPILRISPGEPLNLRMADHEWLIDWHQVREHGAAMIGPPASTILPAIGRDELRAEAAHQLDAWRRRDLSDASKGMLAYAVLAVSRAVHAVERGAQASKQDAATWVGSRHHRWAGLTQAAIDMHARDASEPELTLPAVRAFIAELAG